MSDELVNDLRQEAKSETYWAYGELCGRAADEIERLRGRLAEAERLLDSGMIRLVQRDDYGQVGFCIFKKIDLRKCISEAIASETVAGEHK